MKHVTSNYRRAASDRTAWRFVATAFRARPAFAGATLAVAAVVGLVAFGVLPGATEAARPDSRPDGAPGQSRPTTTVTPGAAMIAGATRVPTTSAPVGSRAVASPTLSMATSTWGYRGKTSQPSPVEVPPPAAGLTWKSVSVGDVHSCAIASNDMAYCWGKNDQGQLGDGTMTDRTSPGLVAGGLTWRQVSADYEYTCGVDSAQRGWCWGRMGAETGERTSILTPSALAGGFLFTKIDTERNIACGTTIEGNIACWSGLRERLRYSDPYNPNFRYELSPIPEIRIQGVDNGPFIDVSVSRELLCGIRPIDKLEQYSYNDTLYCTSGPLANVYEWSQPHATLSFRPAGQWRQVSSSDSRLNSRFICGITLEYRLGCMGMNSSGQLGIGSTSYAADSNENWSGRDERTGRERLGFAKEVMVVANPRHVSVGEDFACAIESDGDVWCWGANYSGQLGNGFTVDAQPAPSKVNISEPIASLSAGYSAACAIALDGSLWCWGKTSDGGIGATLAQTTLSKRISILDINGSTICGNDESGVLYCQGGYYFGYPFKIVQGMPKLASLRINGYNGCGVSIQGEIWCWIVSGTSLVAARTSVPPGFAVGNNTLWRCAGSELCITDVNNVSINAASGAIINSLPSDPQYPRFETIRALSGYSMFLEATNLCGIDIDKKLWCNGSNLQGISGTGINDNSNTGGFVQIGSGQQWLRLEGNNTSYCALSIKREVFCWGRLGNGNIITSPTAIFARPVSDFSTNQTHWMYDYVCANFDDLSVECSLYNHLNGAPVTSYKIGDLLAETVIATNIGPCGISAKVWRCYTYYYYNGDGIHDSRIDYGAGVPYIQDVDWQE